MAQATFAQHPLHPQLIPLPLGLLPASLLFDAAAAMTRRAGFADAAYYTLLTGVAGGVAAAAAGVVDYLAIPPGSRTKRIANLHAGLNVAVMAAAGASAMLRRRDRQDPTAVGLSLAANAVALVSAWYGGHLVYALGMRVEGKNPIAGAPVAQLPGDAAIAEPLHRLEELAPSGGPYVGRQGGAGIAGEGALAG